MIETVTFVLSSLMTSFLCVLFFETKSIAWTRKQLISIRSIAGLVIVPSIIISLSLLIFNVDGFRSNFIFKEQGGLNLNILVAILCYLGWYIVFNLKIVRNILRPKYIKYNNEVSFKYGENDDYYGFIYVNGKPTVKAFFYSENKQEGLIKARIWNVDCKKKHVTLF